MNRLIMSSSPQTSYTVSFSIVLSSAVAGLSADGHERKMQLYSIFVLALTHSRKKLNVVYVFFLIALSYTPVAAMCFLPPEFRTSANLTGFQWCVRTYMHVFAQISIFVQAVTHSHKKLNAVQVCFLIALSYTQRIWHCQIIKMGLTSHTTPTVRDIFTFAVLCLVIRPFLSLYFMLCRKNFKLSWVVRSYFVRFV